VNRLAVAVLAALVLAPAGLASERHPTQRELERELVCVECHTTLDESDSPIARQMKAYVARRIREGATKSEIEGELVDQFGPAVLGVPRKHGFDLLAWVLPLGGIALGALILGGAAVRWSRASTEPRTGRTSVNERPLDPDDERRVDVELERFE
jgi:cytochrome c-type biogenesis protein CcmH